MGLCCGDTGMGLCCGDTGMGLQRCNLRSANRGKTTMLMSSALAKLAAAHLAYIGNVCMFSDR